MKEAFRRVFKRQNVLILFLIVSAFLGTIGVPQRVGITSDVIVMALLAILALDMLIERLGYLERIEEKINSIEASKRQPVAQDLLYSRQEAQDLRTSLAHAKEVWFTGRSLVNVLDFSNFFEELAREHHCRFKFLLPDPKEVTGELMYGERWAIQFNANIKKALSNLNELKASVGLDLIEVRVLKHFPSLGLTVIDGQQRFGRIIVQMYPYACQGFERPLFDVRAGDKWYRIYYDHFVKMWDLARPYEFDNKWQKSSLSLPNTASRKTSG
jgi:hypothetical protein